MSKKPSLIGRLREESRVLSFKKIYNVLMGALQLRIKSPRVFFMPGRISIETGNVCNLRCPLCPTGQMDKGVARGFMDFEKYKQLVDELKNDLFLIRLYNWGEPLLNKNLLPMIKYAHERGIGVTISTNLNILDIQTARSLMDAGLQKIFISCNGISDETYDKYHIGGKYSKVMDNMRLLIEEKKKRPKCITRIIWLFHVFRHNEHEVEPAVDMANKIGVEIRINKMRTDMGKEIFETAATAIKRDRKWIPDDPKYCAFDLEKKESKQKRNSCSLLWKDTVINWEGSVLPCCSVYEEKYTFGNAFEDGFKKVWNSEAYMAARKEMADKNNTLKTVCHICKSTGFTHF